MTFVQTQNKYLGCNLIETRDKNKCQRWVYLYFLCTLIDGYFLDLKLKVYKANQQMKSFEILISMNFEVGCLSNANILFQSWMNEGAFFILFSAIDDFFWGNILLIFHQDCSEPDSTIKTVIVPDVPLWILLWMFSSDRMLCLQTGILRERWIKRYVFFWNTDDDVQIGFVCVSHDVMLSQISQQHASERTTIPKIATRYWFLILGILSRDEVSRTILRVWGWAWQYRRPVTPCVCLSVNPVVCVDTKVWLLCLNNGTDRQSESKKYSVRTPYALIMSSYIRERTEKTYILQHFDITRVILSASLCLCISIFMYTSACNPLLCIRHTFSPSSLGSPAMMGLSRDSLQWHWNLFLVKCPTANSRLKIDSGYSGALDSRQAVSIFWDCVWQAVISFPCQTWNENLLLFFNC